MSSKVIHVSDATHARAKKYCSENRIRMSDWLETLINKAISMPGVLEKKKEKKKKLHNLSAANTGEEVGSKRPFWEKEPEVEEAVPELQEPQESTPQESTPHEQVL